MEKEDVKNLFVGVGMTADTVMTVKFFPPFEAMNGDYTFVATKVGRGRGGSLIVTLRNSSGELLTELLVNGSKKSFGTAVAEYIQSINVGGHVVGVLEPTKMHLPQKPKSSKAKENSIQLREALLTLGYMRTSNVQVAITSDDPELNGVWTVGKNAVKHPGRFGQVSLEFSRTTPAGVVEKIEVWSYKDVDRIQKIDVITVNGC